MLPLLSYLFYFVAASASPLQRRWLATKRTAEGIGQVHFAFKVASVTVVLSLLIPFFSPLQFTGNAYFLFLLALTAGIFGAGYFVTSYIAQKHVEAGISTLVSNVYTPITIILATTFLNERLTLVQWLGTLLLLFAIMFVSKKHRIGRFKFDKYFLMMLASGVFLGVVLTAERALQKITGFTAGTLLSWWSQCLFLGIATIITHSKSAYTTKDTLVTGVLRFFQTLSWVVLLFVIGNLSVVSIVTTFKVVVIFIAAALFLKEREDMSRKITGSIIAVVGLLLMK